MYSTIATFVLRNLKLMLIRPHVASVELSHMWICVWKCMLRYGLNPWPYVPNVHSLSLHAGHSVLSFSRDFTRMWKISYLYTAKGNVAPGQRTILISKKDSGWRVEWISLYSYKAECFVYSGCFGPRTECNAGDVRTWQDSFLCGKPLAPW